MDGQQIRFLGGSQLDQFVGIGIGEAVGGADPGALEAIGTPTGNPVMARAVRAWQDTVETLRTRFNAAGGDVGRLDNWGMPHSWSQKIAVQRGQQAFIDDFMPLVDRRQYVHEDGVMFDNGEMAAFLGKAWESIATDGANKIGPDVGAGKGVKANRNNEARQIHFRDGNAALAAYQLYSDRNLFQVLSGHVKRMSRDIAIIEQFGPNADRAFEQMVNQAYSLSALARPELQSELANKVRDMSNLYDYVAGNSPGPAKEWLANLGSDIRSILSAAKLGSAAISSIADEGTLYLTAKVNKIPVLQVFFNELRGYNLLDQTEKDLARRAGLMVKTMNGDINRFGSDTMGTRWSSKMSSFFMRLSGLEAMTEIRRRAFSVTMMDVLGKLTRQHADPSALDVNDYKFLAGQGIDSATWDIWRAATPENWGGNHTVLTPESIYRVQGFTDVEKQRAATRLLSTVLEEQNTAVIEPGARERSDLTSADPAGTFKGELLRSVFLFKSFPHAMITRHVKRGLEAYDGAGGKAGYLAALVALQTVMGAVALEVNDLLGGKDPRNLNPLEKHGTRNLIAALLKGGALGVYGDFLFDEAGASGRSPVETMAGPVLGTMAGAISLTQGNALQYLRGQDTHAGAELARFLKGVVPGSNLWYAKAALDHLIFQQMQEFFSPGYLSDMRAKAYRNAGTTYFSNPGASFSEARMPNFGNIIGAQQ